MKKENIKILFKVGIKAILFVLILIEFAISVSVLPLLLIACIIKACEVMFNFEVYTIQLAVDICYGIIIPIVASALLIWIAFDYSKDEYKRLKVK